MSKPANVIWLLCSAAVLFGFSAVNDGFIPKYPHNWPKPQYNFESNPLKPEQIALGRKLFYDPILSANNTISCASCHLSYTAFTHVDHALSHGIRDSIGTRNSPVLINLAWNKHFMWDGAVNNIEVQALAPISHPAEMGSSITEALVKLNADSTYQSMFESCFQTKEISSKQILISLAQFQLTLISSNAKYDQVQAGKAEFSIQENKGYKLFKQHCNSCHTEPLFTNGKFSSNGLPVDTTLNDVGRYGVSKRPADSLQFKIPTLRNIEFSQPYMHDGRFKTIAEALKHYSYGIDSSGNFKSKINGNIQLSSNDRVDLLAFLLTLTDKSFLFNPDYAYPRALQN